MVEMYIMQVYFVSELFVGVSLHEACNVSKRLAGTRATVFLMPLKETGHKVGEYKHHCKGGQQTQNVKAIQYQAPIPHFSAWF